MCMYLRTDFQTTSTAQFGFSLIDITDCARVKKRRKKQIRQEKSLLTHYILYDLELRML